MQLLSHDEIVKQDIRASAEFRRALLAEAMTSLASGDLEAGKHALRLHVEATLGYEALGIALGVSGHAAQAILDDHSNPAIALFSQVFAHLQKLEGVRLHFSSAEPDELDLIAAA